MSIDDLEWAETDGLVRSNAATVAFADAQVLDRLVGLTEDDRLAAFSRSDGGIRRLSVGDDEVVGLNTGEDNDYPCEIVRSADGELLAARLEFVNDVAELTGEWRPVGELDVRSGKMLACDPFCVSSPCDYVVIDDATGRYRLEQFVWIEDGLDADRLGLRAIRVSG